MNHPPVFCVLMYCCRPHNIQGVIAVVVGPNSIGKLLLKISVPITG